MENQGGDEERKGLELSGEKRQVWESSERECPKDIMGGIDKEMSSNKVKVVCDGGKRNWGEKGR